MRTAALLTVLVGLASPALADLQVRFDEGAPKDRFTVTNTGGCALGPTDVTIDLEGSPYGLIFDVTDRGAGVQVYQPFEVSSGPDRLRGLPQVADGDNRLTLELVGLKAGESVAFTIDVDDTGTRQQTMISDQEIYGAEVVVRSPAGTSTAVFQGNAVATVELSECMS